MAQQISAFKGTSEDATKKTGYKYDRCGIQIIHFAPSREQAGIEYRFDPAPIKKPYG